LSYVAELLN